MRYGIKARGMSRFIIGITGRHFLTNERTINILLILKFTLELFEQCVIVPIDIRMGVVDIAVVYIFKKSAPKRFVFLL